MKSFAVLACIVYSIAFAQPDSTAAGAKPAILDGRVLNGKTGEPIRRANVTLRPVRAPGGAGMIGVSAAPAPYAATTDAEGRFRFDAVESGDYRMTAERQGFITQQYGARRPSGIGGNITLTPGQELKGLDIKMTPQGIITGRVLDDEGEPLARVQIMVLRRTYLRGKQVLMPRGGGQTNDTGEFRIAELAPGRYWLSATFRNPMRMFGEPAPRKTGDEPAEEFVTTYYPGVTAEADARPIEVSAGQESAGLDIRMQKARVYRIRGKVAGNIASPPNVRLMLLPRERAAFGGMMLGGAAVKPDGTFEISGVQAGSYFVCAFQMEARQRIVGKAPVEVSREDIDNLTVPVLGGTTVGGRIQIDGDAGQLEASAGKKITLDAVRVQLVPSERLGFSGIPATPKPDGSFSLEDIGPDTYRVNVYNLPEGLWVKSIRAGDRDVLDDGLDLSAGASGDIQIVLGAGAGTITGSVVDAKDQPASGALVTLAPDPFKEERPDLYRMTPTDQNGQFTLKGIPPGNYKLFAWDDLDDGRNTDPEFLKAHDSGAKLVTVEANTVQQVSLTQILTDLEAR